jgi:hypothetical protein
MGSTDGRRGKWIVTPSCVEVLARDEKRADFFFTRVSRIEKRRLRGSPVSRQARTFSSVGELLGRSFVQVDIRLCAGFDRAANWVRSAEAEIAPVRCAIRRVPSEVLRARPFSFREDKIKPGSARG